MKTIYLPFVINMSAPETSGYAGIESLKPQNDIIITGLMLSARAGDNMTGAFIDANTMVNIQVVDGADPFKTGVFKYGNGSGYTPTGGIYLQSGVYAHCSIALNRSNELDFLITSTLAAAISGNDVRVDGTIMIVYEDVPPEQNDFFSQRRKAAGAKR